MFCDHESQIKSTQVKYAEYPNYVTITLFGTIDILYNGKILYEQNFICLNTHLGKKNLCAEFHLVELNLGQLSSWHFDCTKWHQVLQVNVMTALWRHVCGTDGRDMTWEPWTSVDDRWYELPVDRPNKGPFHSKNLFTVLECFNLFDRINEALCPFVDLHETYTIRFKTRNFFPLIRYTHKRRSALVTMQWDSLAIYV